MVRRINVLLIEDNSADAAAIHEALAASGRFRLTIVDNPKEALAVLRGEEGQRPLPHPLVILLCLPEVDGVPFLEELRRDPRLRPSIVFVLMGSTTDTSRWSTYPQGVAGYFLKAMLGDHFEALIAFLATYCNLVEFPDVSLEWGLYR